MICVCGTGLSVITTTRADGLTEDRAACPGCQRVWYGFTINLNSATNPAMPSAESR